MNAALPTLPQWMVMKSKTKGFSVKRKLVGIKEESICIRLLKHEPTKWENSHFMTAFSTDWLKTFSVCSWVCVWHVCVGGLFIYLQSKIPETVSKTKDMGLSVLRRGMGCEPSTCSRHEEAVRKEPKGYMQTEPAPPQTRGHHKCPIFTSILEVMKVKVCFVRMAAGYI